VTELPGVVSVALDSVPELLAGVVNVALSTLLDEAVVGPTGLGA